MRRAAGFLVLLLAVFAWCEAAETTTTGKTAAQGAVDKAVVSKDKQPPKVWFRPEYMLLWSNKMSTPKYLVSTGDMNDPLAHPPGALGEPGFQDLTDDDAFHLGMQHGARFTVGAWLTDDSKWGVEASGFFDPTAVEQTWSSGGNPLLSLPFFNTFLGIQDANVVAWLGIPVEEEVEVSETSGPNAIYPFSGPMAGTFKAETKSSSWGADIAALRNFKRGEHISLDWKAGFQYFNLSEEYQHTATSTATAVSTYNWLGTTPVANVGDSISLRDQIKTDNDFYGAFVGLRCHFEYFSRLEIDILPRVGLGAMVQEVDRDGSHTLRTATVYDVAAGGLYCLPYNMGERSKTKFAVIPSLELKVGCRIVNNLSAHVGYSIQYVSSVARPTDQMDRRINETYAPTSTLYGAGGATPGARHDSTDFYAHGLNAGFTLRF